MNTRHLLLGAALAVSTWLVLFGDNSSDSGISEPAVRPAAAGTGLQQVSRAGDDRVSGDAGNVRHEEAARKPGRPAPVVLELASRENWFAEAGGTARPVLFASHNWTPPPPKPKPGPPPAPVAPPLPFAYLGKRYDGEKWEVFLSKGSMTYIVRQDSIIEGQYSVKEITPSALSLVYMPLNQVQQIQLGRVN